MSILDRIFYIKEELKKKFLMQARDSLQVTQDTFKITEKSVQRMKTHVS